MKNNTQSFYSSRPGQAKHDILGSVEKPIEFKLNTERVVKFYRKHIQVDKIESETRVSIEINARLQDELDTNSLAELAKSLKNNQFYPVIGFLAEDTVIELMDGSRRRAACLIAEVGIDVLYSKVSLTISESQDLAEQIQSAEKHSHRDLGAKYLRYRDVNNVDQKEVAAVFNVSESHVSTCITAYSIDVEIIKLFLTLEPLVAKDYRLLNKLEKQIKAENLSLESVIKQVQALAVDDIEFNKEFVLKSFKEIVLTSKSVTKEKFEPLASFNKNKFIRRKTDASGHKVTIEFSRIEKEKLEKIETFIKQVASET